MYIHFIDYLLKKLLEVEMHRLFYLLIAVVMLTSSVLLAQEPQESKVDRYIALYLDADSGNIIPGGFDGNGIFAGNEFEFGTSYRQNFSKAQWLFFDFTILSIFKQVGWYEDEKYIGLNGGQPYYGFMGGAYNIAPRARVALTAHGSGFGANGLDMYLSIDTRTLVVFALGYTFYFGGSGDLRIGSSVEFFANPIAFAPQGYTSGSSAPPAKKMHILDVFVLSLGYNINFAERWNYSTLIEARFGGLWNIGLSSITLLMLLVLLIKLVHGNKTSLAV